MAKGLEKHQEHLNALSLLGKPLARRSGSKCELCSASGVKLQVFEIAPIPAEPDIEHCAFLCDTCVDELKHPKKLDPHHWRCLQEAVWSEQPSTQVLALRLLKRLAGREAWAASLLEEAYVEEDIQSWADQADLA